MYRRYLEPGFDEAAFLDGATDAYFAVNELWVAGDAAALAPLTTPPVGAAFAAMLQSYKDEGLFLSFKTLAFHRARITDFSFVSSREARRQGPRAAVATAAAADEEPEGAEAAGAYFMPGMGTITLSFSVRYDVEDEVELRRGGPDGPVAMRMRDYRGHVWTFARPMPKDIPFEGADTPWKLMDIA